MTSLFIPALILNLNLAHAQECDSADLQKRMDEASPRALAGLYEELASCDPEAAAEAAPASFEKILSGDSGVSAGIAAVRVGAGTTVREWVSGLLSDERASTLAGLGSGCEETPELVGFFTDAKQELGERFWRDRWHRALADCHSPQIHELLRTAFQEDSVQKDSSRFGSILEVFCDNAGHDAIPWLKALIFTTHEENQLHIVSAFANAAGVGSIEGTDQEAANDAVAALLEVAPKLPAKVVEQARISLESMGAQEEADGLAAVRFTGLQQADGRFLWGTVAVETATCKNGKTRLGIHHGQVLEPGHRWPDQMHQAVEEAVLAGWELDLGEKCKGESRHEIIVPSEPFADEAAYVAWRDEQLKEIRKRPADKLQESEEAAPVLP